MLGNNNLKALWVLYNTLTYKCLLKKNILVNKLKKSIEIYSKDDWK